MWGLFIHPSTASLAPTQWDGLFASRYQGSCQVAHAPRCDPASLIIRAAPLDPPRPRPVAAGAVEAPDPSEISKSPIQGRRRQTIAAPASPTPIHPRTRYSTGRKTRRPRQFDRPGSNKSKYPSQLAGSHPPTMQRIIKRTVQAEKQVARRMKKRARGEGGAEKAQRFRDQKNMLTELNQDIKAARLARQEKWDLGPLAPRRDMFETYGALQTNRQGRSTPLKPDEIEARCEWAGGVEYLNLAVKDRVVLLEGPEKGKIDRIASINLEYGTVQLEEIGKVTVHVPESFQNLLDAPTTQNAAMNIPISAIRLVHPIVDPATGVARDVVVRQLARGPVKWSRTTGWRAWTRYIPGANIAIPWPEREAEVREDQPGDTLRLDAEAATFVPTLLSPPMPASVIDELRNKYSRFRTRHEDEYIMRKEAEEAEKKALKKASADALASMRTPLQELNRELRDARRARGKPELSSDMLERIGEIMARNKATVQGDTSAWNVPTPRLFESKTAAAAAEVPKETESHPPPQ
ncbi:KOW domain-containing protein domain-containing protein [Colletotrichum filicis]|nr:KOW domain-containing protein domain-containing protein [Colletotrichum filicis]